MAWFFRGQRRTAEPPLRFNRRARIVCPQCNAVNPAGSRFCNQCGKRLDVETLARTASAAAPAGDTPPPPHVEPPAGEERRIVTILFADLVGSTELADTLDAEDLRELLADYFARMSACIHEHGGGVEKFIGDAIMGVFGLPRAHEDDPIRAIRAALDMQATLRQFNAARHGGDPSTPDLHMRIGINTGEVVAATGPVEGRDFLVTGDAVNVAARLQQTAAPDAVVVGPRTFRNTQSAVLYQTLPPAQLRGKPRPIRIWQVTAMRDTNPVPLARARTLDTPRTPLIGREVELDLVQTMYARVIGDRQPHVVTILGEPGVGKTRLAREFIAQTHLDDPPPTVLIGRCAPYGEGVTYWPIIEMVRDYCGFSPTTPPAEARARLADCVAQALDGTGHGEEAAAINLYLAYTIGIESPEQRATMPSDLQTVQKQIVQAWRTFFEVIARPAPLIMLVDDIHWADDALLDLLENIAARSAGSPIILLCTARPDLWQRRPSWGAGKRNYVTLALEPLSTELSNQLIDEILASDAIPHEMRQNILRRTEGNPFFIEEILRMLIDRGLLVRDESDHWQVSSLWAESDEVVDPVLPDTVQGVLAARIDLLPPEERDLLCRAAIVGRTFWPSALASMTPYLTREQIDALLQSLIAKDLITPATLTSTPAGDGANLTSDEPRYLFRHTLTRDVAYDLVPRARRAHDHERFAEWLEQFAAGREMEYAEMLARHYEEYYRQAGLSRSRNVARRQAIRDKVIHYLDLAGDRARRRFAPHAAIRFYSRALTLLREATEEERRAERDTLISLYRKRGDARALQTDGDGAWKDYRSALQIWLQDDQGRARAPDVLASLPPEERATGMRLYRRLVLLPARFASWFRQPPPYEELRRYLDAGLRLTEESGDTDSLDRAALLTAKTFFWWSWPQGRDRAHIDDALESAEEAATIAERLKAPRRASEALDALGNMQAAVTDLKGFLRSQRRRLFWAQEIDDPNELVDIHNEVSAAYQMVGQYSQAIEHATIALRQAEQIDNDLLRAQALQRLTVAYYEWDRWSDAANDGEQMVAIAARTSFMQQNHYRWGLLALVVALTREGKRDRADQIAQQLDDLPVIPESQYVGLFRGRLQLARGNLAEAEQIWRDALKVTAGRHSYPALLAELAELGARQDRRDLTDEFGARALDIGERSGARKPLAQALRARGIVALADRRLADAERDLTDALQRFQEFETRWEEARTRYVLATLRRRQDDAGSAQHELEGALHLFEQVRAVRDIARAKAALAGGEIRLP
jgi:class 3 adenylate cyclase